ncbi:MAG TPA: methylmalonyl-CoA mutase family protein [Vicinamibacterales bacterium]|jgi:methylmalonyl-CoA mutase
MSDSHESIDRIFPPVATADWEAQIRKDLKGADYDKKLVWKTDEGIAVRPYYRSEHATRREPIVAGPRSWVMAPPGDEPPLSVSVVEYHDQGATAVQELAFALAQGADLLAAGTPVTTVGVGIGSNYFIEIAKLRALRLVWAQVAEAFGAPAGIRIHARTGGEDKTLYDPYVNMLRVTTEAISAIAGNCDSLTITPCLFDAHLAENVHHILREESQLDKVADPGAGSYSIEALTDAVAADAWTLFQAIEAADGWSTYRASGAADSAVATSRQARDEAVASRRRVLVGTNNYPNLQERELDAADQMPGGWRLASMFESIRLRTERHAKKAGRTPRVLLLERGDLSMRKARAAFCQNFFGCAGFEIVQRDTLGVEAEASPDSRLPDPARDEPYDLVVICSSDAEYLALAHEICPKAAVPVIVAGNPKDQIDALKAAGIADFVHVLSNAVDTLRFWQDRLGIGH